MANLLPQDKKKEIRKEYRTRVLIVSLFVSGAVFIIVTVLLSSLYILLDSRLSGLNQTHKVSVEKEEDLVKLEKSISETRAKLELLKHDNSSIKIPYGIFKSIIDIKPENVSLREITYSNSQIAISGLASNRNNLQDFVVAIGDHELFLPVDYPFSNITQKKDIDFSLTINFAKNDEE